MNRIFTILVASVAALSFSSASFGQTYTTEVDGNVDIYVDVYNVDTLAKGNNAFAFTSVATIHDRTLVKGNVYLDVTADDIYTEADGANARACTFLGSVGAATHCGPQQGGL